MREALIRKLLSLTVELLIRFRRYLQMLSEERRDLPCVDRFPRHLSGRVVTTRKPHDVEIDTEGPYFSDDLLR